MAITHSELVAVLQELAPALVGGWIQKIGAPQTGILIFEVRIPGSTLRLLVSLDAQHARLHLVTRPHPNPSVPPPFCQFLRARLLGARLDRLTQLNEDRIARLDLTTSAGPRSIVVELFGKHADLLVLDADESVLATYRRVSSRIGQPYHPPSRWTADQPVTPPVIETEARNPFPVSAALEQRYGKLEEDTAQQRLTGAREALLRKTLKKQRRLADALSQDMTKATRYERHARYGELLKGALGHLKKGQDAVTVVDYFDEGLPELTIPLDPSKTPQGNMEDYFGKHRKYLTAQEHIAPRIESIQGEIRRMEQELEEIRLGRWQPEDPAPSRSAARPQRRTDEAKAHRRGPFRRFTSSDGLAIYVGRNAHENDELTFGFAKSDDLWLHAHGAPGSHVVVRLERGTDPPVETLRDAATLALLYSDLKKAGKGDVIYTRRKWIRKAKGAGPGSVTVTQERSLFIRLDKARLDALKHRSA